MAASWNVLKRDRDCLEWGREDEPLSKRINNLHLDSASSLARGNPCSGGHMALQQPGAALVSAAVDHLTNGVVGGGTHHPSHGLPHLPHNYSQAPGGSSNDASSSQLQQTNCFVEQQPQQQCNAQSGIGEPTMAQYITQMHSQMREMMASRELPESLSIHYPSQNPTSNPHYFVSNRVLHDLHLDRLKRSGKF